MKTIPTLVATALVLALVLSPMVAFAAGSITFSSPSAGSSYKGTQSYTIAGTISPAPGIADNVFVTVKNPSGVTVDAASVSATPSSGFFSYPTATGGSANWVTGTYTIAATDSYGATGTTTFTYTAAAAAAPSKGISIEVTSGGPFYPGQSFNVYALVQWSNGSLAAVSNFPIAHYHTGTALTMLGTATMVHKGFYFWTVSTTGLADGVFGVHIEANASGAISQGLGSFTINSALASSSALNALSTVVGNLQTSVGTISAGVANIQSTLQSLSTSISSLSGLSGQISTLSGHVTDATNALSSTQTYVLVVAVLAAITLVLELAILVRKLS